MLSLAALLAGAAAMLAVAVAFPFSDRAPVTLGYVTLGVALAMLALTLVVGDRLPRSALLAEAVVAATLNGVLVAAAHTQAGAIGDAFAYLWLTVYVSVFFPPAALAYALFEMATFGLALLDGGLPRMGTPWAVIALGVVVLAAVLSRLSVMVRRHLHTDPLTGALNRTGLEAVAPSLFARTRRRGESLTVAALDLDAFKAFNDRRGHLAGDRLLTETVAAWRASLRGDDAVVRVGGDEFVVLMPATSPDEARAVLTRLQQHSPAASSAGLASWEQGEPLEHLLHRADQSLYAAKAQRA